MDAAKVCINEIVATNSLNPLNLKNLRNVNASILSGLKQKTICTKYYTDMERFITISCSHSLIIDMKNISIRERSFMLSTEILKSRCPSIFKLY